MEVTNDQLQTKYQKIASEYSKIRAQANVLKKAVIDEQMRSNELQEQLKEKEVEIRRSEQELDSLTFRNQQLTKRVTVLQEELDETQNRGVKKSSRSKSSSASDKTKSSSPSYQLPGLSNRNKNQNQNHNILDEEFEKKIIENAQLVSKISDKELEIISLNERIDSLETKIDKLEKIKNDREMKYEINADKLNKENEELKRIIKEKREFNNDNSDKSYNYSLIKLNDDKESKSKSSASLSPRNSSNDCETEDSDSGYGVHHQIINNLDLKQSTSSASPSPSPKKSFSIKNHSRVTEKSVSQEDNNDEYHQIAKLSELEKELSFWKGEFNVLKIKFDQIKETEKNYIPEIQGPVETTNMLGKLSSPFSIPEEIEARENRIKEYYKKQIEELISEKHVYRIKNFAIAADTNIMSRHLETSENARNKCERDLKDLEISFAALKEDLEVQEGNYKSQLSTISEHLANMNDKLIRQTEEIQQLKFELGNKNLKKGKQK